MGFLADRYNRVGGKQSNFLPTFVFGPLTPPSVPFHIERFVLRIPIDVTTIR